MTWILSAHGVSNAPNPNPCQVAPKADGFQKCSLKLICEIWRNIRTWQHSQSWQKIQCVRKHLQRQFGVVGPWELVQEENIVPRDFGHSAEPGGLNPAGPWRTLKHWPAMTELVMTKKFMLLCSWRCPHSRLPTKLHWHLLLGCQVKVTLSSSD